MTLIWLLAAVASAQEPEIGRNGVMNAASRIPASLNERSIARGSLFVLEGVHLDGAQGVAIQRGGRSISAVLRHVRADQVEALLPASVPLGPATIVLQLAGGTSKPFPIRVTAADPGIFTRNGKGWGPVAGGGFRRGGAATLSTTGLGQTTPELLIGGRISRAVVEVKRSNGIEEVRFAIPGDAPTGCHVPIQLRAGGALSNTATISIEPCKVPEYFPFADWQGHRAGFIALARTQSEEKTVDEALGSFVDLRKSAGPGGPLVYIPSPGTCGLYLAPLGAETSLSASFTTVLLSQLPGPGLDAGRRMTVAWGNQLREVPPRIGAPGMFVTEIGANPVQAARRGQPLFFGDGEHRVAIDGGAGVTAFAAMVPGLPKFALAGAALPIVDRSRDLALQWSGLGPNHAVLILALATRFSEKAGALCYCVAPGQPGSFRIPAALLSALPKVRNSGGDTAQIILVALSTQTPRSLPGLEKGIAFSASIITRNTEFR